MEYARSGEVRSPTRSSGRVRSTRLRPRVRGRPTDVVGTAGARPPLQIFAAIARVLGVDKRGTGLSDGFRSATYARDADGRLRPRDGCRRVGTSGALERAGRRATGAPVCGDVSGADSRARAYDPHATSRRDDDYPWAPSDEQWRRRLADAREGGARSRLPPPSGGLGAGASGDGEFLDWFVRQCGELSPGAAVGFLRATMGADVRDFLAAVRVPTLCWRRPNGSNRRRTSPPGSVTRALGLPSVRGLFTWLDAEAHERAMDEAHAS